MLLILSSLDQFVFISGFETVTYEMVEICRGTLGFRGVVPGVPPIN